MPAEELDHAYLALRGVGTRTGPPVTAVVEARGTRGGGVVRRRERGALGTAGAGRTPVEWRFRAAGRAERRGLQRAAADREAQRRTDPRWRAADHHAEPGPGDPRDERRGHRFRVRRRRPRRPPARLRRGEDGAAGGYRDREEGR